MATHYLPFAWKPYLHTAMAALALVSATAMATDNTQAIIHQSAPSNGWAAMNGGTRGGSQASAEHIYHVTSNDTFRQALNSAKDQAKILLIEASIDLSGGQPYTSFADQKRRSQITIPSNTTIIGMTQSAGFKNGSLIIKKVHNVIVRNVTIETPVDVAPHFEKGDGWNAEWDGMNITTANNVWVDHITITDGSFTDSMYQHKDGWKYVQHDGELDIKRGSDYVTISNSVFENHDKTMLIGHSDHNGKQDQGKLHVTIVDNVFHNVTQRTPRVRFGQIHAYNNVFLGNKDAKNYHYSYSFGMGAEGKVLSENNSFQVAHLSNPCDIYKDLSHGHFGQLVDNGSLVNDKPLDLNACGLKQQAKWSLPYHYQLKPAAELNTLIKQAGAGKLFSS